MQHMPMAGPPPGPPPGQPPGPPPTAAQEPKPKRRRGLTDPLSILLIVVIVLALVAAGLMGAEIYARHVANGKVASAAECVAEDNATVSFSVMPPFLWQHINGHYDNITVTTAGNQIKSAKGMTANVTVNDVDLNGDANSKGTIGALDATITWTAEGIQDTVQASVPLIGSLLGKVTTNPSDGTVALNGTFGNIVAKPQVVNNKLTLQVVSLSGLGFILPKESVQPTLDTFTDKLANDLPLGIHADSVQVTDTAVVGHFSTQNAKIPVQSQNPCFANL
jgi:LmeA-like phospholipid-binding